MCRTPLLLLTFLNTAETCPSGRVVSALGRHVQYSVTRSVAGVCASRLNRGASHTVCSGL